MPKRIAAFNITKRTFQKSYTILCSLKNLAEFELSVTLPLAKRYCAAAEATLGCHTAKYFTCNIIYTAVGIVSNPYPMQNIAPGCLALQNCRVLDHAMIEALVLAELEIRGSAPNSTSACRSMLSCTVPCSKTHHRSTYSKNFSKSLTN
jgi:hypothetical protein